MQDNYIKNQIKNDSLLQCPDRITGYKKKPSKKESQIIFTINTKIIYHLVQLHYNSALIT